MLSKRILVSIFVIAFLLLLVGCLPGITPSPPKGIIGGRIMAPGSEITKDITGWIPVANATVTITDSEGVTHTVTTDEDGYYTFTDIAVDANTIITATAIVDGNTVIIKDVIPQAVAADEDYDAKTADAESTALALIVEELLEQGLDPKDVNLEEIQDSDNFTEIVEQVTSILEENGNVTTDPGLDFTVGNVAEDIISPPVYIPPEEIPEPEYTPPPVTPAVNHPPIITSTPDLTTIVGIKYTYTIKATDPDGDTIIYSLVSGPTGMTFNGIATISWTPTEEQVGVYGVTVKASDGKLSNAQNFAITVSVVEPEPEIELTGIKVVPKTMTLIVGKSETIESVTATYEIRGYEVPIALGECIYLSSDTDVATVSDVGLVTAVKAGTATITVNFGGKTDTVEVTVSELAGSYSYSWTTTIMDSTDFDFTVGMGWSGPFSWPPNVYFFFHPDEIPLGGYLEPIGGAWLFDNIDFGITSAGQTFSVTSVTDDPDFAGFANLLTNGTDEGIWFGYMGDCDNIASAGGQKDVQESLVFSGTDVGTDFPDLAIQSISLTFNQIYLDPDNVNKLVLDFTIDIYAGLPNS